MPRYVALLRGVMPTNCKMPELKRAFESAGFTNVKTVLATGNVVFDATAASNAALEKRAEAAMQKTLATAFMTIVRPVSELEALLASDPYKSARVPKDAKRIVTFLREAPKARLTLPIEQDGAHIVGIRGGEVFSAYVRSPKGPVFMVLIERTFGKEVTTRTWDTLAKIARQ
jgi:uncharacterized protein (DUF1697 family)